jgi:hypothetical protein
MSGIPVRESAQEARFFPVDGWTRSTFCGPNGGNCVEVNRGIAGLAGVRDSKPQVGPVLVFADSDWRAFLGTAGAGRFHR